MSTQAQLDFGSGLTAEAQPPPLARKTDPPPSHIAARRAGAFAGSHEAQIVAILSETQEALTTHEIADRSRGGLTNSQVHHRTAGLVSAENPLIVKGLDRPCRCNRKDPKTCDGQLMQTWKSI